MKMFLEKNETLTQIVCDAGPPPARRPNHPPSKNPAKKRVIVSFAKVRIFKCETMNFLVC